MWQYFLLSTITILLESSVFFSPATINIDSILRGKYNHKENDRIVSDWLIKGADELVVMGNYDYISFVSFNISVYRNNNYLSFISDLNFVGVWAL